MNPMIEPSMVNETLDDHRAGALNGSPNGSPIDRGLLEPAPTNKSVLRILLRILMLAAILDAGRRANIETVEFSWILEDNRPSLEGCRALGAQLDKLYRIYAKPL